MPYSVAAVDLGATSGRVVAASFEKNRVSRLEVVHRFSNTPLKLPSGLHWNVPLLFQGALNGLGSILRESSELISVGVDSWAIDYGLLHDGRLLGLPFHYRDKRSHEGVADVHGKISAEELFSRNGLQFLHFNTLYQLAVEGEVLDLADQILLIPDLISYWLTGQSRTEMTNASTTGLLNVKEQQWDQKILNAVGLHENLFAPLIQPGETLGPLRPELIETMGSFSRSPNVIAVGSHDTASAVLAIPFVDADAAYISCGTWALVGLEIPSPVLTPEVTEANFTNERSISGEVRFLKNVMGMWVLDQTFSAWRAHGETASIEEIVRSAKEARSSVSTFDVNDPRFQEPGDMTHRIHGWYSERGLQAPSGRLELVRAIIESLAQSFAEAVRTAERLTQRVAPAIHIVGGGALNHLLCQLTADFSGKPVHAGPVEATALGNALLQARTADLIPSEPWALKEIVQSSVDIKSYVPSVDSK